MFLKLSGLKQTLRKWNKKSVGSIFTEGKRLECYTSELQAREDALGLSTHQQERLQQALVRYHNIYYNAKSLFGDKKSRPSWLQEGSKYKVLS